MFPNGSNGYFEKVNDFVKLNSNDYDQLKVKDRKSSGMLRPRVDETLGVSHLLQTDSIRRWSPLCFSLADKSWSSLICFELFNEALATTLVCLVGSVYPPKSELC
ncbi:hypothetical protein PVK06_027098 [Gossypium arboreum]|uniref:Uncharacterized protein n=1 Tax=Gossypium arboreum TaxID=29729 RepID=A0ABR0P0P2_GOSAR|nr:hypothetical protein PVK06_027098 [Gossypium arboreum]